VNYLRVKNWSEFQHYKDRNPAWIKLHVAVLDDYEFCALSDVNKAHLILIWLFASKNDGRVPNDAKFLKSKIGLEKEPNLEVLVESGFLLPDDGENAPTEKWASRYISDAVRQAVMERAGNKCQACGTKDALELDHILPISQGGTGEESNLQVLCRPCNRKKRVRSTNYADAEQDATQIRSLEKRREETEKSALAFDEFWQAYPRKVAKPDALKAWKSLSLQNGSFEKLMAGLEVAKASEQWAAERGRFIPHPATWLRKRRWEDEVAPQQKATLAL
jgi:hypothetical protein